MAREFKPEVSVEMGMNVRYQVVSTGSVIETRYQVSPVSQRQRWMPSIIL